MQQFILNDITQMFSVVEGGKMQINLFPNVQSSI
jgi:hypothetical protein